MLYDVYFHFKKEDKEIEDIDKKWRNSNFIYIYNF